MGIEKWLSDRKAEARKRNELIERAKQEQGIHAQAMGGFANTHKVVLDMETFRSILDRLSNLE